MGLFRWLQSVFESAGFYVVEKVSPFTDVEICQDGSVRVQFEQNDYALISINDIPVVDIIGVSKKQFKEKWEKRFIEDLTQVMAAMGKHPSGGVVKLVLRDLKSGQIRTAIDAPLTKENRQCLKELRKIPLKDVPPILRNELDVRLAGFKVISVLQTSVRSVYFLRGNIGKVPIQIKFRLAGEASNRYVHKMEVHLETRSSYRSLKGKRLIDKSLVPANIWKQTNKIVEQLGERLEEVYRVKIAKVQGRTAYDIKGWSGKWMVEVETLDDGQILEVQFEYRPNRENG